MGNLACASHQGAAVHTAAVHALELAYFYVEKRRYGCDGDEPILVIVAINALVFAALAGFLALQQRSAGFR